MTYQLVLAVIIMLLGYGWYRAASKRSRLAGLTWDELVARLKPVPMAGVSTVALDYLHPMRGQLRIKPVELWTLIGGDEGLRRMYANADVLIALADFAQLWNMEEGIIVAERMRRDGIALRRATFKLSLSVVAGESLYGPFNVQEAATAYYLMRQRLLALYETSHIARHPQLAAVL